MLGDWGVGKKDVIKGKEAYGCLYLWASSIRKRLSKEHSTLYCDFCVDGERRESSIKKPFPVVSKPVKEVIDSI